MNKKNEVFLLEYEALCRKHGIALDGCGCCGSPYLVDIEDGEILSWEQNDNGISAENVSFRDSATCYSFIKDGKIQITKNAIE